MILFQEVFDSFITEYLKNNKETAFKEHHLRTIMIDPPDAHKKNKDKKTKLFKDKLVQEESIKITPLEEINLTEMNY